MNYKTRVINLIRNQEGNDILGIVFHTKNHSYFYDAGTGNVRNCWANLLCRVCYAACYNCDGIDIERKRRVCVGERTQARQQLALYHELLEEKPSIVDELNKMSMS